MADWTFFDHDPETGCTIWFQLDGDKTHWRIDQAIDPIIEANVEAEKASHGTRFGEWNRFASVPLRLMEAKGLDTAVDMQDHRFLSRFFNDTDNAKLRTSRGKV